MLILFVTSHTRVPSAEDSGIQMPVCWWTYLPVQEMASGLRSFLACGFSFPDQSSLPVSAIWAVITEYYRLGGLQTIDIYLSETWRLPASLPHAFLQQRVSVLGLEVVKGTWEKGRAASIPSLSLRTAFGTRLSAT